MLDRDRLESLREIVASAALPIREELVLSTDLCPAMTDGQVTRLARGTVVILGTTSLGLAIYGSSTLVSVLLIGYARVAQFFPGVVLGLY